VGDKKADRGESKTCEFARASFSVAHDVRFRIYWTHPKGSVYLTSRSVLVGNPEMPPFLTPWRLFPDDVSALSEARFQKRSMHERGAPARVTLKRQLY